MQQSHDEDSASPKAIRLWLLSVIEETGLKPTPLAKEAGLAPSTLLRALDPDHPGSLENRSIEKIVQKFGVAPPRLFRVPQVGRPIHSLRVGEFTTSRRGDKEVAPLGQNAFPELKSNDLQSLWEIKSSMLESFGYLEGDIIVIDTKVKARLYDVVVAAISERDGKKEDLVLRLYDPPYLVTGIHHFTPLSKPLLVDNDRISIFGVVTKSLRVRKEQ